MARETEPAPMARLTRFLHSVIPADPTQLIFLCGVLCLVVSVHSSWLPKLLIDGLSDISWSKAEFSHVFEPLLIFAKYPIMIAALAGYFLCLWSVKRPVAAVVTGVIFPALLSLCLMLYAYYKFAVPPSSFLVPRATIFTALRWIVAHRWNLSTGFYLCLTGVILCLLFLSRLALGLTTLPLTVADQTTVNGQGVAWPAMEIAIFLLLGPLVFLETLITFFIGTFREPLSHGLFFDVFWSLAMTLLSSALLIGVPLLILGRSAWALAKKSFRVPKLPSLLWGFLLPLVVAGLMGGLQFLGARVRWAARRLGDFDAPDFKAFFVFSGLDQPRLLLSFIGAFAEEVVFRGVLLALLRKRYGLHRGVLFTGLIWAAYHFPWDGYYSFSVGGALLHLVHRTVLCVAMNYVLAWMTLRWASIIPAGLVHSVSNILIFAGVNVWWGDAGDLRIVFWSILAYILWRYWPVATDDETREVEETSQTQIPLTNPEPTA